jgi:hypothetical protein
VTYPPTREHILCEIRRLTASSPDGGVGREHFTKATSSSSRVVAMVTFPRARLSLRETTSDGSDSGRGEMT